MGTEESRGDPNRMKLSYLCPRRFVCSWSLGLVLVPGAAEKLPAIALLKTCKCLLTMLSYCSQPLTATPWNSVDSSQLSKSPWCLFLLNWLFTVTKLKIVDTSVKEKENYGISPTRCRKNQFCLHSSCWTSSDIHTLYTRVVLRHWPESTKSESFKPFSTLTPRYEIIRKFVQCHPGQSRVLILADKPLSHLILQQFLS